MLIEYNENKLKMVNLDERLTKIEAKLAEI